MRIRHLSSDAECSFIEGTHTALRGDDCFALGAVAAENYHDFPVLDMSDEYHQAGIPGPAPCQPGLTQNLGILLYICVPCFVLFCCLYISLSWQYPFLSQPPFSVWPHPFQLPLVTFG